MTGRQRPAAYRQAAEPPKRRFVITATTHPELQQLVNRIRDAAPANATIQAPPATGTNSCAPVEIAVTASLAPYTVRTLIIAMMADCSDANSSLSIPTVADRVRSSAAHRGVIVAPKCDPATQGLAVAKGLTLVSVADALDAPWRVLQQVPALANERGICNFNLTVSGRGSMVVAHQEDVRTVELYREDHSLIGTVGELVISGWQQNTIPHILGDHTIALTDESTYLRAGDDYVAVDVGADIRVEQLYYLGDIDPDDIDPDDPGTIPPETVRHHWQPVGAPEELCVTPLISVTLAN